MEISDTDKARIRILIVEDNRINQIIARGFLNRYGLTADMAKNGREAIQKIEENDYHLVLMDVQMPEMDGLEATRFIRTQLRSPKRDVKIMAMTASVMEKEINKCFDSGMNGYIAKPFDPENLYEKITAMLNDGDVA